MEAKFLGVQQAPSSLTAASFVDTFAKGEKWRRGESEYSSVLKIRKLLKNLRAQESKNADIVPIWNLSGTLDSPFSYQWVEGLLERRRIANRA